MPFVYLASPYSHPDKFTRMERYKAALRACDKLMEMEMFPFSPVAYGHAFEAKMKKAYAYEYWIAWDLEILRAASRLYVLTIPGWDESSGIEREVRLAHELDKPVIGFSDGGEDSDVCGLDILGAFGLKIKAPAHLFQRVKDNQVD